MMYPHAHEEDMEVAQLLDGEDRRQAEGLELIPSENYVSSAVREAMASTLTNKYSEGYPGARYYGGQEFTDGIERLAIERAKTLFGAAYANVQPLGGANANIAAYMALCKPGDTILGMELSHGGHLTHGSPVTYLSQIFRFVRYRMKDVATGAIDYEELEKLAHEHKPKVVLAGFSSYPRTLDWKRIADIAHSVDAIAVADVAHIAGLIAGGALENPFDAGFDILTTTTHKTLRGPRGGMILVSGKIEGSSARTLGKLIDKAVFPGLQGGPHMNQIAAKAVAFHEALQPSFRSYAQNVLENASAMARVWNAAGAKLVTGGTENHLLLADAVSSFGIGGKEAEILLDRAGITLNKNTIPDDPRSPLDPAGIRFGTPALTTRGFTTEDCEEVAELMLQVVRNRDDKTIEQVRARVLELAVSHPIPESF